MADFNPRDLEWQRRYEEDDTPWDKGYASPVLTAYLRDHSILGRVLIPGCGKGHEVRALAQQDGCSPLGLDLSFTAVTEATRLTADAGLAARAHFVVGDFFHLPANNAGSFDWIFEHTCFCALDPRQRPDYVPAAASALRAGGKFFGIFYVNPKTDAGPPFEISRAELDVLFSPHFDVLEEWIPTAAFPGREGRELVRILQKR